MAAQVRPFLMFQEGKAEEAIRFYLSAIPGSEIVELERYGPGGPAPEGTVKRGLFMIGEQVVMCTDSPIKHGFDFTPSFSFWIECETEAELERLAALLAEDGSVLMPLGAYGFSRRFTWVADRFGVSWQLNLA